MNHRNSALIAMFVLFGAIAVEVRLERPRTSVELYYDQARLTALLPWRSLAFDLRYDPRLLTSFLAEWAPLDMRFAINMPPPRTSQDDRQLSPLVDQEALSAEMAPAPEPAAAARAAQQPELDIARISPEGTSVFAGHAAPGSTVTVLEADKPVGTARAGADGGWSLTTEHRFASADPDIELRPGAPSPAEVAVAGPAAEEPAVAAAAPAAESGPTKAPPPDKEPASPTQSESSPAGQLIDDLRTAVEAARQQADEKNQKKLERLAPTSDDNVSQQRPPAAEVLALAPPPINPAAPPAGEPAAIRDTPPETTVIPVPIPFEYKQATLTEEGRQAAALLLEYLKLKAPDEVTLSGHADEIGEAGYNMKLSQERLNAVVRLLRAGGYAGKVNLLPKGESQPFSGVDRSRLTSEELMQLDRRVELRIAR